MDYNSVRPFDSYVAKAVEGSEEATETAYGKEDDLMFCAEGWLDECQDDRLRERVEEILRTSLLYKAFDARDDFVALRNRCRVIRKLYGEGDDSDPEVAHMREDRLTHSAIQWMADCRDDLERNRVRDILNRKLLDVKRDKWYA